MDLASITPLILTWNEESNLRRCLERLPWAKKIVVVDSGSSDKTLSICNDFPRVEVKHRDFDNHTAQWNHGLDLVETRWVLTLDADYLVGEAFAEEISMLPEDPSEVAFFCGFRYLSQGFPLRGSLYPPRALLFDRNHCRYRPDGHTQLLVFAGRSGLLRAKLDHDDRKPLTRWFDSQLKYARLEAEKLASDPRPTCLPDRLRKMIWPAAPAAFLYTLFIKGVILDGWPGWFYALQRTYAELVLSLFLLEKRFLGT